MRDKYILTAESVTEGHPDKLCDTIADSVLDACLKGDSSAHVACEVLATAGKVLVAGYTAATKIDSLAMLPNMNISNAMSSFTAQNIGAGKYERVKEGLKACLLMVAVFSLLITVIIFLFGNQLLSLFLDPGDASGAMGYGLAYMHTVSLFYILMGLLFVPNGMLRGAGDMAAFTFSSMANLFSRVGIAYALVYLTPLGANAIWWSIPAGWAVGAAVSLLRVKSGKWMRKAVADR